MPSSCDFYTWGKILEFIQIDSVTSAATGYPKENLVDFNLDTYWKPTTTGDQTIVTDLNNDLQEMITQAIDRDFSSASGTNWTQQTMDSFSIFGGWLLITASDVGQYCQLGSGGFGGFTRGRTYRLKYDYTQNTSGFHFQQQPSGGTIGTCVAGIDQTITFTASRDSTVMLIVSDTSSADGEFDNISIRDVTDEADFEVDGFAIFICNYKVHFGDTADLKVEWSDDGTNWTSFATKLIETEMTNAFGDPVRIYINGTSQKRRYWRFIFENMDEIIEVGGLLLVRTRAVSIGNAWPEQDRDRFLNAQSQRRGNTPVSMRKARRPVRHIPRQWQFIGATDLQAIQGALADSFGSLRPLIFHEGSDYRVVKFLQEEIDPNQSQYQIYSPYVIMQELPYIEDGQVI